MASSFKLGWVGWITVVGVAASATYYYGPWRKKADENVVRFETAAVDRGPVVAKVTASGTLSALVTVQVGSQVSGRVKEINVDFNSAVHKGQVIARIDPQLFQATLDQARANYAAAQGEMAKSKAQARDAQRQLARTKALADQKLIAAAELDTAQANAEAAEAQVMASNGRLAQAKASLSQAQVNLTYTDIISPIEGVVISRSVDVGQTVAASLQAPVLFVLAEDLRRMQVDTSVAEADIGKLRPGMDASFTVDAYPQQRFKGTVRQIRNAATNVQNVVTYDAVIDVANPDLQLKPGMTANVRFVYASQNDALRVPNAALRFKPTPEMLGEKPREGGAGAGGGDKTGAGAGSEPRSFKRGGTGGAADRDALASDKRTVWLQKGTKPSSVEVRIGITDGSRTEVLEGALKAGDLVITDAGGDRPAGGQSMPMRRVL